MINSVVKASSKRLSKVSNKQGKSIHACVLKQGLDTFSSISNSVMDSYMKCRALESALGAFWSMQSRDSVSQNVLTHRFLHQGNLGWRLSWFRRARVDGFEPNVSTLVLVLQAHMWMLIWSKQMDFHTLLKFINEWSGHIDLDSILGMQRHYANVQG